MEFNLGGKRFDARTALPLEQLIVPFLTKMRDGELIGTTDLCEKLGRDTGEASRRFKQLKDYCIRCPLPTGTVWGNSKTIAALRRSLKEQGFNG